MNTDLAARLIARLLALRFLPRDDAEVRRLLVDASFRDEVDARLAASGLRLLAQPFASHVSVALAREHEAAVFEQNDAWQASNIGLPRDAAALLVILWALIVLPKRERQLASEATQTDTQNELFETVKLTPAAHEASRGIPENVLLEDYGKLLGGRARLQQFALPQLSRLGFIERRNKVIHEGPLLDLAFDYAEFAPRILEGALSDLLKQRGVLESVATPEDAS
ncbi:MAG: hypothetical protein BGP20_12425 [Thiobacillus sp. 63-78]|uniref:hypothetical protein n=1 Tax=Thiobacillus sp. 63-78 TaxID=1895859 RepID=UPI000964250C|nr:hypothetical protein [Thiobacillus sp. 63-78]MBN8763518.1 hypothetical protein [Thiobacillus sp.]OJZ06305.1 MAG: hypothetical protein BGP20_12425 [Thiobacillus sp. 63-78]